MKPANMPTAITDMSLCSKEEVSSHVHFEFLMDDKKLPSVVLNVHFAPPRHMCKFGISLLANESIRSEKECHNHKFEESVDINAETHTAQMTVCALPHQTDTISPNSTNLFAELCQENITLGFQYVFTGCYAIMFHLGKGQNEIHGNVFVQTNYNRTEIMEPSFNCKYGIISTREQGSKKTLFVAELSVLADTPGVVLQLGSLSNGNNNKGDTCGIWYSEPMMHKWTISMLQEYSVSNSSDCSINLIHAGDGKVIRTAECRFVIDVPEAAAYCFLMNLRDQRCRRKTLWNPPMSNNNPCTWMKRCNRINNGKSSDKEAEIQAQTWMDANSYLLLPVFVIIMVIFATLGMVYFIHYWRTRNKHIAHYTHTKALHTNGEISRMDEEKEKDYDETFNKNIVLLYAKNTESFMAIMAHFRKILARVCHCDVHDWYDGSVWNHVAEIGGPEWFSKILDDGCRVIWMDTPVMRNLVTAKFHKDVVDKNSKQDCMEIGDFRDVLIPTVFNFAKREAQKSVLQYPKHFIARMTDFDNFMDHADPFTELSPSTRYLIPQDFRKLCSHLNATDLNTSMEDTRLVEDMMQQHLICVESDFPK